MSSIVEVESWRVAEILGTAAAQLELLALVPKGKRLATVASAGAERSTTTSSHSRRGPKGSTTGASGPAASADAELADALAALVSLTPRKRSHSRPSLAPRVRAAASVGPAGPDRRQMQCCSALQVLELRPAPATSEYEEPQRAAPLQRALVRSPPPRLAPSGTARRRLGRKPGTLWQRGLGLARAASAWPGR